MSDTSQEVIPPEPTDDMSAINQSASVGNSVMTIDDKTSAGLQEDSLYGNLVQLSQSPNRNGISPILQFAAGWALDGENRIRSITKDLKELQDKYECIRLQLASTRESLAALKAEKVEQKKIKPLIALSLIGGQALLAIAIDQIKSRSIGLGAALLVISLLLFIVVYMSLFQKGDD